MQLGIMLTLFRMKNLSAQLAKVELAQQKKEELVTEKSSKTLEVGQIHDLLEGNGVS